MHAKCHSCLPLSKRKVGRRKTLHTYSSYTPALHFERLEERLALSTTYASLANANYDKFDSSIVSLIAGASAKLGYDLAAFASDVRSTTTSDGSLYQIKDESMAIQAVAKTDTAVLASELTQLGMTSISIFQHLVTGFIPFSSIASLATLDSLNFASPIYGGISNVGSANSQGDEAQRTDVLRAFQRDLAGTNVSDLTGAGITIGVISDSFDQAAGSAATDIAAGDLPGNGNPNMLLQPVNVIRDNTIRPVTNPLTDEGRAMLQIVHDVAPRSNLAFANVADIAGIESQAAFAANILSMRNNAHADVIVDDWSFYAEPFFMDGFVAQAVDQVVAQGTTYVSAAGNMANDSYEVAGFLNSGQALTVNLGGGQIIQDTLHDFDPGAGIDTWQTVVIPPGTGQKRCQEPFF